MARTKVSIPDPGVLHETFFGLFKGVKRFQSDSISAAEDYGFVYTAHGYKLYVPPEEPHSAVDYRIQGTAGWHIKLASVRLWNELLKHRRDVLRFVLDVHDQLVLEGKPAALCGPVYYTDLLTIKSIMEDNGIPGMKTPVNLEIIKTNWAEGIKVTLDSKGKIQWPGNKTKGRSGNAPGRTVKPIRKLRSSGTAARSARR